MPQFDSKQFLRHFRVSPETFDVIMNSIVHSITDDIAWPGGSKPILPGKKLLVFLWYMANQETLREISNTFAIGTTTVHEIVMTVSEAINENLVSVSKNYGYDYFYFFFLHYYKMVSKGFHQCIVNMINIFR